MSSLILTSLQLFYKHPSQKKILALALPMVLSSLSTPMLGVIDTSIVGHLGETSYLSGVAMGSNLLNFLFFLLVFLRMSTVGLSGQSYGSNNQEEQVTILIQGGLLAIGLSLLILLFHPILIQSALSFMKGSNQSLYHADLYLNIRIYCAPATLLNYVLVGWFTGRQNTKLPMFMIFTANSLNILFDLLFVIGLKWNVSGVAWASVIAEYSALLLALFYLIPYWKKNCLPPIDLQKIGKKSAQFTLYFKLSYDIFWRSFCLQFVLIFFTMRASVFGDTVLSANNVLMTLLMLVAYSIDGFAVASESISSVRLGEKNRALFKIELGLIAIWSLVLALLLLAIFFLFERSILTLFTNIPSVIDSARIYLPWLLLTIPFAAWSYFLDGIFIGITQAKSMRNSMFIAVLGYLLIWSMTTHLENHGLWLAFLSFTLLRGMSLSYRLVKLWQNSILFKDNL